VQEALISALQHWSISGVPEQPKGWLFRVARNRALDQLRRDATLRAKEPDVVAAFRDRADDPEPGSRTSCATTSSA